MRRQAGGRGDVDHSSAASRRQQRRKGTQAEEGAGQVHIQHAAPPVRRLRGDAAAHDHPGIVHQHIEPAEHLLDPLHSRRPAWLLGDIKGQRQRHSASGADRRRNRLGRRRIQVGDHHGSAFLGEALRQRRAKAAAAPGH
jgi:hypothetical protein